MHYALLLRGLQARVCLLSISITCVRHTATTYYVLPIIEPCSGAAPACSGRERCRRCAASELALKRLARAVRESHVADRLALYLTVVWALPPLALPCSGAHGAMGEIGREVQYGITPGCRSSGAQLSVWFTQLMNSTKHRKDTHARGRH